MANVIYYFSGRGNSLSVAQGLSRLLPDTRVASMASARGKTTSIKGRVGIILPVIDFGIPELVRGFLSCLKTEGEKPYVYAVITCGGMPGASILTVKNLLKKRGVALSAGWVLEFGRRMMTDGEWRLKLEEMAQAVERKEKIPLPPVSLLGKTMTGLMNPLARLMIPGEDKKFRVADTCTGCGICARVCPAENIRIINGKPSWQHHCEQCAACFSWCPKQAISGSCLAAKTHYQNARVSVEQLFDQAVSRS